MLARHPALWDHAREVIAAADYPQGMRAQREDDGFPGVANNRFPVGEEGNSALFGRDVLRGLVRGIEDFVEARQERWRPPHRPVAPTMIACSPWLNDDELLAIVAALPSACIVIGKHPRAQLEHEEFKRLLAINEEAPGFELRTLVDLADLAPKVGSEPLVVGPGTPVNESHTISTVRTIGHRKSNMDRRPPHAHAKLALLGHTWSGEAELFGYTEEFQDFTPMRLWMSSANFTNSSRRSLEWGFWTEIPELLAGAARFLIELIGASEELDALHDEANPELAPYEFDDDAMAEYLADLDWDDDEDFDPQAES